MILIYEKLVRPIFFAVDAERSHHLALGALQLSHAAGGGKIVESFFSYNHPSLQMKAFNLSFSNPVGLAAGFDKDARYLEALASLGFGFLEVGTVTREPQAGNSKPRMKRLPKESGLWNHLGFNNDGAPAIAARLSACRVPAVIGINIGKSKTAPLEQAVKDYLESFELLSMLGDYLVLNVSSPNTPGVRALQEKDKISALLRGIEDHNRAKKPILVKVSPDLSFEALDALLDVSLQYKVDGFIATNTTLSRGGIGEALPAEGGISGKPLAERSTAMIRHIYRQVRREACVIGSGGIFSADDAYEKIRAGACLVQIYTGLVYRGPGIVREIKEGLVRLLREDGFDSISEAVGVDAGEGVLSRQGRKQRHGDR